MEERIQKIISAAGITSRRAAEDLILEGRVRVNGKVVTELGSKADPEKDHIKVDGKLINPQQPKAYIVLNKPVGYVTTMSDPEGRQTVQDLLKGVKVRVYPVGRLDYNTEGLLLLTNDGDFAHLITHPKYELPKTYLVKIKGVLNDEAINRLESGVFLTDGKTAPARVKRLRKEEANSWVEITIHEGKKRQVRRMIDHVGNSVIRLKRVRVGNLPLGNLPPGSYRHMTPEEVTMLRDMAEGKLRETKVERVTAEVRGRVDAEKRGRITAGAKVSEGVGAKARETRGEDRWTSNKPFSERGTIRGTRDVRATRGPAARVQGKTERREAPGQMRGRVEAEKRVKPRWTKDEGRERPRGATSVRGRTGEQRGEARWTGNKPFGVKRKTEGSTWRKPGTGSQRPNERRKPPTGRPRRPPR